MPRTIDTLTDLQRAWAHAYVGPAKFNATEAARMVGYSESEGRRMRAKAHVMDYVERLQREQLEKWNVSQGRTIAELCALAFSDIGQIVQVEDGRLIVTNFDDLPQAARRAIKKVKLRRANRGEGDFDEVLELELYDKIEPLKLLGQYQGLFSGDPTREDEPWTGVSLIPPGSEEGGSDNDDTA